MNATARVARAAALAALWLAPAAARGELADPFAPPPRPAPLRVPIEVGTAPDVAPAAGTPVTAGVPFAEGWLASPDGLRLETESGEPVPAQLSVRGAWPRTGGVRWLGVDFALAPGATRYALVADEGGAGPAPESPVRVEETPEAFFVSTGELRAEVPRRGGLLRRAWWRGELALEQDESNWLTHLADGRRFSDRGDAEARAELELAGPLHVVIRVEGRYRGGPQDPAPRWIARLHFHAGRPTIGITHTFVWVGGADALQIRELALGFRLARPATRAAVDQGVQPGDGAVEAALRGGRRLALVQERHFAWGAGESRFVILSGLPQKIDTVASGARAGAWIDAGDGRTGVSLALRDLWRQHPKELRADAESLTAFLWSGSGASPPLDLRFDALEKLLGPVLSAQLRRPPHRADWDRFRDPRWHDPTGFAKTHDLQLAFHDGDWRTGGVEALADAFDREPVALPDPHWTDASRVLGRLAPRDPAAFPELEARIDRVWGDVLALVEDFGDHGFFGFGSGPHHAYEIEGGRAVASPWRFTGGVEYDFARAVWAAWLRSGERAYRDLATAHSRYLNDLVLCHEDSPSRRRGDWFWSSGVAVIPWGGAYPEKDARGPETPALGVLASFGFSIEHALHAWYLTGDARSLEVAREYAAALKAAVSSRPGWAESTVAHMNTQKSRHAFQRMEELAVLWEQLGDPWFREEADRLARLLLAPADATGIRHDPVDAGGPLLPAPYAVFYKAPNVMRYARAVDGEARQRALVALLRTAEWALRTQDPETRTLGLRMAAAFAISGDPLYLGHARRGLGGRDAGLSREPTGTRGYRIKLGGVPPQAYNTLANEVALMAALREAPALPEPFPALWKQPDLPAADLVLRKAAGAPLHAQVSAAGATFEDPRGRPWPAAWTVAARDYAREGTARPFTWREVRIPAEAPAGEYRIRAPRDGAATVLSTDAAGLVLVAPNGFQLGGEPDPAWFFQVPDDTETLRVTASDLALLELHDGRGEPVRVPPRAEPATLRVPDDGAGTWSVSASRPTSLVLEGVPAVFAFGARERLFAAALPPVHRSATPPDDARFPAGQRGLGLRLSGRDSLAFSTGAELADGRFERWRADEGTLEFWVRPDWDAALLPHRSFKGLFALEGRDGALEAYYSHALDSQGQPTWDLVLHVRPPGGEPQILRPQRGAAMRWTPERFVHVAFVWYEDERGQRWALYVDGVRNSDLQGGRKRAWPFFVPREVTRIRVGSPGPWKDAGAIDGVIDGLRLSSVARWRPREEMKLSVFAPPREPALDADTLALFEFEGDLRGRGPGDAPIEAELVRAPIAEERPGWQPSRDRATRGAGAR